MSATQERSNFGQAGGPCQRFIPWYRRLGARAGIQTRIVLCFLVLLAVALGIACWQFMREMDQTLSQTAAQRAIEVSQTLAMASETPMEKGDLAELNRIGKDLLKNRDIVTVAFFSPSGRPLAVACQDPDYLLKDPEFVPHAQDTMQQMMQVRHKYADALGPYAEVVAPVLRYSSTRPEGSPQIIVREAEVQLVGYVLTAIWEGDRAEALARVRGILLAVSGGVLLLILPLIWLMVHRIFSPIRQLVGAADRIAAGDLDAQVAIDRPDVIGMLARSFNEMVNRVRQQRQELAAANQSLAEANRDLEERIGQRTTQLESANKRLSSEIAEKEDFLRAVSHDLTAPLRNIAGMATMLLMKHREKLEEEVIHRLERIQKNVEAETDLIGELLELSRIKTRRQKLELVDIEALVGEVRELFEDDLRRSGIRLIVDGMLPVINCERMRIRQVFQNLIDNAIKYMGDSPVREIHVGSITRPQETEFYVRDTGIGIESDDLGKVFCVFRRGKSSVVQAVAGKGVGLALVKSIVETYSGTIWVRSEMGKGSTFTFTISGKFLPSGAAYEQQRVEEPSSQSGADLEACALGTRE